MSRFDANINEEFGDSSEKPTLTVPVTIGPDGKPMVDDKFFENNQDFKNFAENVKEKNTYGNFQDVSSQNDEEGTEILNKSFGNINDDKNKFTPDLKFQESLANIAKRDSNGGKSKKARKAKKSKGGKSKKARKSLRRK